MKRVGLVIPSSNVVIEDFLHRRAGAVPQDIGVHIARLPVTAVDLGSSSRKQFDAEAINQAIDQLLEAGVDQIVFAGTAGAWLGIERENRWRKEATERAGVPVTSTTLLTLKALTVARFKSLGLVTPFSKAVHEAITSNLQRQGFSVGFGSHLGVDSSRQMADLPPQRIAGNIDECFQNGCDGVLCFCTNFRGFEASQLAQHPEAARRTMDSVYLTLAAVGIIGSDGGTLS